MTRRRKSTIVQWHPNPGQCGRCGHPVTWHTVQGNLCAVDGCDCRWASDEKFNQQNQEHRRLLTERWDNWRKQLKESNGHEVDLEKEKAA